MAKKYDWEAERAKRNLPPVLPLPARCEPECPAHAIDDDDAFACDECGAIYYSLIARGKLLGLLCSGCGVFREITALLTEAGY